jgi:hypothetical protein
MPFRKRYCLVHKADIPFTQSHNKPASIRAIIG